MRLKSMLKISRQKSRNSKSSKLNNGLEEIRTPDLRHVKATSYRLDHEPGNATIAL